jgi:hypothetical protein
MRRLVRVGSRISGGVFECATDGLLRIRTHRWKVGLSNGLFGMITGPRSVQPEHCALLRPVQRQVGEAGEPCGREVNRLPPIQNGGGDLRREKRKPCRSGRFG